MKKLVLAAVAASTFALAACGSDQPEHETTVVEAQPTATETTTPVVAETHEVK